jgi:hypothetical protein
VQVPDWQDCPEAHILGAPGALEHRGARAQFAGTTSDETDGAFSASQICFAHMLRKVTVCACAAADPAGARIRIVHRTENRSLSCRQSCRTMGFKAQSSFARCRKPCFPA